MMKYILVAAGALLLLRPKAAAAATNDYGDPTGSQPAGSRSNPGPIGTSDVTSGGYSIAGYATLANHGDQQRVITLSPTQRQTVNALVSTYKIASPQLDFRFRKVAGVNESWLLISDGAATSKTLKRMRGAVPGVTVCEVRHKRGADAQGPEVHVGADGASVSYGGYTVSAPL